MINYYCLATLNEEVFPLKFGGTINSDYKLLYVSQKCHWLFLYTLTWAFSL